MENNTLLKDKKLHQTLEEHQHYDFTKVPDLNEIESLQEKKRDPYLYLQYSLENYRNKIIV